MNTATINVHLKHVSHGANMIYPNTSHRRYKEIRTFSDLKAKPFAKQVSNMMTKISIRKWMEETLKKTQDKCTFLTAKKKKRYMMLLL